MGSESLRNASPEALHLPFLLQAFASYMSAVATDPTLVPALLSVGVLYKSRSMLLEALAAFTRARELKPDDPVRRCSVESQRPGIRRIPLRLRNTEREWDIFHKLLPVCLCVPSEIQVC